MKDWKEEVVVEGERKGVIAFIASTLYPDKNNVNDEYAVNLIKDELYRQLLLRGALKVTDEVWENGKLYRQWFLLALKDIPDESSSEV